MSAEDVVVPTASREEILREKRGQGLAARDAVRRDGDSFLVSSLSLRRGNASEYRVSREASGRVGCTCSEFELEARANQTFRCEHIHAVKHWQKKHLERPSAPQQHESVTSQPDVDAAQAPKSASSSGDGKLAKFEKGRRQMRTNEIEAQLNGQEQVISEEANTAGDRRSAKAEVSEFQPVPCEFVKVLRQLRQPIDAKLIRAREGWTDRRGNKHMVEYVEWHTVADILDRTFPSWSHRVQSITQIGGTVAVVASITIGGVTREGVGTGAGDTETGIKKAEHDALKRAAVKFGIARELYQREAEVAEGRYARRAGITRDKDFGSHARSNRGVGFGGFPQDPIAKRTGDLVTPKQLGMINRMAREAGVDAEKECRSLMKCKPEDLSKSAASSFIDYLKESPQSATKTERRTG